MNTIHRLNSEAAQRIYERTLTEAQRKHRLGVIDPLGVRVTPTSDERQAALLAKARAMRDEQRDLCDVAHWMTDETPWDLPQECPKIAPGSVIGRFEGENEQCSEKDAPDALKPFNGHTYQQIAFSALVLMGAGLLCLLGGVALGAWIALERFAP